MEDLLTMPTYSVRRARPWPYLPAETCKSKIYAAQYREKPESDPAQPTAALRGDEPTTCPKCGRELVRRELWRGHRC